MGELKCFRCSGWPCTCKDGQTIIHGDCREVLPLLPKVDLVLTDPPYGMDYKPTFKKWNGGESGWASIRGDGAKFAPQFLLDLKSEVVLWGASFYSDLLPRGDWLVWDKRCSEKADRMIGVPVELAWTKGDGRTRIKRLLHGGVINADSVGCNN